MFWRPRKKSRPVARKASLALGPGQLDFTLVRSSRRSLGVQILKDGAVVVRAPRFVSEADIGRFLAEKSRWIARHRERLEKMRNAPLRYRDGALHPWLGENLRLKVDPGRRALATLTAGAIRVSVLDPASECQVEAALKRLYKREAPSIFQARIEARFVPFGALGHKIPGLKTRWMERNFGSMSRGKIMTLNLKLLRASPELIDYVIVHELCHLAHMNHGKGFYALMDGMMPDWKARKKALHGEVD
jgi:predicted metal-dependent hydrolase